MHLWRAIMSMLAILLKHISVAQKLGIWALLQNYSANPFSWLSFNLFSQQSPDAQAEMLQFPVLC